MGGDLLAKCLECEVHPLGVRLSDVFESTNEPIIVTDTEHRIVFCNKRAEEMHGFEVGDVRGKSVIEAIVAKKHWRTAGTILEALNESNSFSGECVHLTKDGREIPGPDFNQSHFRQGRDKGRIPGDYCRHI